MSEGSVHLNPFSDRGDCHFEVESSIHLKERTLELQFLVLGPIIKLKNTGLPAKSEFHPELWKSTCFELFITNGNEYLEWNLATNGSWACFHFSDYRKKISDIKNARVYISSRKTDRKLWLDAQFEIPDTFPLYNNTSNISCILDLGEEKQIFYALSHPKTKPDFHLRDHFVPLVDLVDYRRKAP